MKNLKKMNVNENFTMMISKENRHLYLCFVAHFENTTLTQSVNVLKKESILETVESAMGYFKRNNKYRRIIKLSVFEKEIDRYFMKKPLFEFEVTYKEPTPQQITEKISLISFDTVQNLEKQLTAFTDSLLYKHFKKPQDNEL
jgi:hypothetical protein